MDTTSYTVLVEAGFVMAGVPFRPADNPEYVPPHTGVPQRLTPMPTFPNQL